MEIWIIALVFCVIGCCNADYYIWPSQNGWEFNGFSAAIQTDVDPILDGNPSIYVQAMQWGGLVTWHSNNIDVSLFSALEFDFFNECPVNYSVSVQMYTDMGEWTPPVNINMQCGMWNRNHIGLSALNISPGTKISRIQFEKTDSIPEDAWINNIKLVSGAEKRLDKLFCVVYALLVLNVISWCVLAS